MIPRNQEQTELRDTLEAPPLPKRILYIEDSSDNRMLVRRILEAKGYEVLEAENGLDGIKMAQDERPDLILMDINIPGMDGLEATARLRSSRDLNHVPIIAVTAYVMPGDRDKTLAMGCDGYIPKPIDVDRFPDQVQEYLRGKQEPVNPTREAPILREFSQKISIELEKKIRALEQKIQDQATLTELTGYLTANADNLENVLNISIHTASRLMGAAQALIYMTEGDELVLKAFNPAPPRLKPRYPYGEGIPGWIAMHRRPITYPMTAEDGGTASVVKEEPIQNAAAVPLKFRSIIVGALVVADRPEGTYFDRNDIERLTILGNQISSALENAKLYGTIRAANNRLEEEVSRRTQDLNDRVEELTLLLETSKMISDGLDLESRLTDLAQIMTRAANVTTCRIASFGEQEGVLSIDAAYPVRDLEWSSGLGQKIRLSRSNWSHVVLATREPVMLMGRALENGCDTEEMNIFRAGVHQAVLVLPLVHADKAIGMAVLGESRKPERNPFTPEKRALCMGIANQVAAAVRNLQLFTETRRDKEDLTRLQEVGLHLHTNRNLDSLLPEIARTAAEIVGAETVVIPMLDDTRESLQYVAGVGNLRELFVGRSRPISQAGLCGWVMRESRPVLTNDVAHDTRVPEDLAKSSGIRHALAVPLFRQKIIIGGITALGKDPDGFSERDLRILSIFANQASIAIENARLLAEVREANFDSIKALAEALETKDAYTRGHSDRAVMHALAVGNKLGLSEEALEHLKYAAIFHDIGKIGIPDSILNKPGKLTTEEYEVMKTHPQRGADILTEIRFLAPVVPMVLHHQERYDGKGYPKGLAGKDIPIQSRIVAVLDAFDAMTSNRIYRTAPGKAFAVEELTRCSGTQFDSNVVRAFLEVLNEIKDS